MHDMYDVRIVIAYPVQVSGHQLVSVPVPASMYQTVVANIQPNDNGQVQVNFSHSLDSYCD